MKCNFNNKFGLFLDEHSKDAWFYDEADMLDMDAFDEPDPDSDFDYEESYSSKRKRRKPRGGGHHPARNHLPSSDMPAVKRAKVRTKHKTKLTEKLKFLTKNV